MKIAFTIRQAIVALLLALCLPGLAMAQSDPVAAREVDALIADIAALKGAIFIRNGSEYDATKAAEHMRLKRSRAGKRLRTAEDFIRYCATASSMSGKKYRLRFADGREQDVSDYLSARLQALRRQHAART
ncbi:DUF5329 family protein [Arenimonas sp.]|uniref:DUF5329 family protein n=1 Tax=Arenimonas sp. TaxID=1872635 RepID=UPI0039E28755